MVVSPDVGGVVRARALAKRLDNAPLAIVDSLDRFLPWEVLDTYVSPPASADGLDPVKRLAQHLHDSVGTRGTIHRNGSV